MSRFRVLQFNMQFGQVWDDTWPDRAPVRLEATEDSALEVISLELLRANAA